MYIHEQLMKAHHDDLLRAMPRRGRAAEAQQARMPHIDRTQRPRIRVALAMAAGVMLALAAAPAAFASVPPPRGNSGSTGGTPGAVHVMTSGGMPGWQITLITVAAALVAALTAVVLDRMWMARKTRVITA
jgi:hypothetical protein